MDYLPCFQCLDDNNWVNNAQYHSCDIIHYNMKNTNIVRTESVTLNRGIFILVSKLIRYLASRNVQSVILVLQLINGKIMFTGCGGKWPMFTIVNIYMEFLTYHRPFRYAYAPHMSLFISPNQPTFIYFPI